MQQPFVYAYLYTQQTLHCGRAAAAYDFGPDVCISIQCVMIWWCEGCAVADMLFQVMSVCRVFEYVGLFGCANQQVEIQHQLGLLVCMFVCEVVSAARSCGYECVQEWFGNG